MVAYLSCSAIFAIQAIGDVPYINKKWLDYLGLEIPTTTDELEQVLIINDIGITSPSIENSFSSSSA